MTVKEVRILAYSKYRSHKFDSWTIGVVCGLFCAAVIGFNLLVPLISLITVPIIIIPFMFACTIMNVAVQEGMELSLKSFFKYCALYFQRPFSSSLNVIRNFLKSVLVFALVYGISTLVAYNVFANKYGDSFVTSINQFVESTNDINVTWELLNSMLLDSDSILLRYFKAAIEPPLYASIFIFMSLISKEFTSIYLRLKTPNSNPRFIHSLFKRTVQISFGDYYKCFFGLNWPFFVLMAIGCTAGGFLIGFTEWDPLMSVNVGVMIGFGLNIFFFPFFFHNNMAMYEAFEPQAKKASQMLVEEIIRKMEILSEISPEDKERFKDMVNQTKDPLGDDNKPKDNDKDGEH